MLHVPKYQLEMKIAHTKCQSQINIARIKLSITNEYCAYQNYNHKINKYCTYIMYIMPMTWMF